MSIPGRRPISITLIGLLFLLVGIGGIARGAIQFYKDITARTPEQVGGAHGARDFAFVVASGLLAMAGGFYTFRGRPVGRGLLVVWMACHVVISLMHSLGQLAVHCVIFAVILFFLYRPRLSAYFRRGAADTD